MTRLRPTGHFQITNCAGTHWPSRRPPSRRPVMKTWKSLIPLAAATTAAVVTPSLAQNTIKIGELNSYKAAPAFLDPYKRGIELALEEINAAGGGLRREVEFIIPDCGGNPGDGGGGAAGLVTSERTKPTARTLLSQVALPVA